jgi:hypothetical protein
VEAITKADATRADAFQQRMKLSSSSAAEKQQQQQQQQQQHTSLPERRAQR